MEPMGRPMCVRSACIGGRFLGAGRRLNVLSEFGKVMEMKNPAVLLALFLLPVAAVAQESSRKLEGPGEHAKYLTPGQLDEWVFDAEKGETIIAHVATKEFDSILELATKGEKEDKVLFEVDDAGSNSRFSFRLPAKGEYKIRVHAFKYKGGGNYVLHVRRFQAAFLEVGKPLVGTFNREGSSHYYFRCVTDRILIVDQGGASFKSWKMLDIKGRDMANWSGAVTIEEDGEYCLEVSGHPYGRYNLLLREARRQALDEGRSVTAELGQGEMDVWSFQGRTGDFRLLEVEKKGELVSRLVYAPLEKERERRIARAGDRAKIQFLPAASRGGNLRYAAVLGRDGRYQVHLLARTPVSYRLKTGDPTLPIAPGQEAGGTLPVGGCAFYSFSASPGQLFQASLSSKKFVPLLRLYDSRGNTVEKTDGTSDDLESRVDHMVVQEGLYRLQIGSLGDGGGGDFRVALQETKLKELEIGGRGQGTLRSNGADFWTFSGKEGKVLFLSLRSTVCQPVASIRSPDGVELASDNRDTGGLGSLLAVKLPKTGRYTIWISSRRGVGPYTLRLIDGD